MKSLLLAALVIGTVALGAPANALSDNAVTAHRGDTARYVENTRGAVLDAFRKGHAVEFDVRTTRDDKLMLMHDRSVARTTNGRGYVDRLTARRIRQFLVDDGQRVPYVAPTLKAVRDRPAAFAAIELKVVSDAGLRRLATMVAHYGIESRVVVMAFNRPRLERFAALAPSVRTYALSSSTLPSVDDAASRGGVCVRIDVVTDEWVSQMHRRGVPFGVWNANTPEMWEKAERAAGDFIVTDTSDELAEFLRAG